MKNRKITKCRLNKLLFLIIWIFGINLIPLNVKCQSLKKNVIEVYISSQEGDRLTKKADVQFTADKESSIPVIEINDNIRFQEIDGFGATFNEAGMICLNSLNSYAQENVLRMLFDPDSGAGYTAMKSPIAACDFASAGPWYTYDDTPGDTILKHFSIKRDLGPNGLVTFIKNALKYGSFKIESPMDFAPDWMYLSLEKGKRHLKPEYYNSLAKYYVKYVKAYAANRITINYLDLFNESGVYSEIPYKVIGELIKNHVGPLFQKEGLNTKIQLGETPNSLQTLTEYPPLLEDRKIRKYIHSLAFHGYSWGTSNNLTILHNKCPEFPIWQTEICYALVGNPITWSNVPHNGPNKLPVYKFSDGEFWGNQIMNDMKNWVSAWLYWNMILDQDGGPCLISVAHDDPPENHQQPIVIINRNTGEVTYTGLYYYLAHFSKFIRPGAHRIKSIGGSESLNFAAFQNSDGSIVLNVINNHDKSECKILWQNKMIIQTFKAHSITTLKWQNSKNNGK